jgi:hypothetical protein
MKDYTYLYRDELFLCEEWEGPWDLFISAFNTTERVGFVFNKVPAKEKHWLVHNEYRFLNDEHPSGDFFISDANNEADFILEYADRKLSQVDLAHAKLCIDLTGFMRPHMMFLVKYLVERGATVIDAIYSEPSYYSRKERTQFAQGSVTSVRQVAGFEGLINNDNSCDLLIVGAGYETALIAEVAEDKDKARKAVVLGLPSLSADMYQQNALLTQRAADALGESLTGKHFAPANDPFVTASVLSDIVDRERKLSGISNLYLSPLATKAQALGFTLFFLGECNNSNASIIFPFSTHYGRETSKGIARVWKYRLEFPL